MTSNMSYCDCQNSLEDQKERVINYIKSNKSEMLEQGLDSVYIEGYECDFGSHVEITISVIYVNKFIDDYYYHYWKEMREKTRNNGATYVSNCFIGDRDNEYLEEYTKIDL